MSENNMNVDVDDIDDIEENDAINNQFLTFAVGNEIYGIEILKVIEIIRYIEITSIPESIEYIKGVINLRGKIIPVMDIRLRFDMPEKEIDERTCIIVSKVGKLEVGLVVDSVSEVTYVGNEQIEDMPDVSRQVNKNFIKGIGKVSDGIIILIDLDKLIQSDHLGEFP